MRVTENRLIDLSAAAVSKSRDSVAEATQVLTSGERVSVPSTDEGAWEEGMRAGVREDYSKARARDIGRAHDGLNEVERGLNSITETLLRASELSIQGANGSLGAAERLDIAAEMQGIRDHVVAQSNIQFSDGEYLLAGSLGS